MVVIFIILTKRYYITYMYELLDIITNAQYFFCVVCILFMHSRTCNNHFSKLNLFNEKCPLIFFWKPRTFVNPKRMFYPFEECLVKKFLYSFSFCVWSAVCERILVVSCIVQETIILRTSAKMVSFKEIDKRGVIISIYYSN